MKKLLSAAVLGLTLCGAAQAAPADAGANTVQDVDVGIWRPSGPIKV